MLTLESFKPLYQSFLESGSNVREFCQSENLRENKFYYWQSKLRGEVLGKTGDFMPVSVNNRGGNRYVIEGGPHAQAGIHSSQMCEIVYPNGVTVRLTGSVSPEAIRQLVQISR